MGVLVRSVLALAVTSAAGCLRATSHLCLDDRECGSTGRCEPTGFCSFVDPTCDAGHRYGDGAGDLAGACVAATAAADGGVDAVDDRDDDGAPDLLDNCADVANSDQHDEDADGVGDVCDNCPHLANVDQLDARELNNGQLADGVGDECDPSPMASGNAIVFFDPFSSSLASEWTWSGTTIWSIEADVIRASALNGMAVLSHPLILASEPEVVITTRATATATASTGASSYASVGAAARMSASASGGFSCSAVTSTVVDVGAVIFNIAQNEIIDGILLDGEPALVDRGFLLTYTARAPGNGQDNCTVVGPADSNTVNAATNNNVLGTIGLAAARVEAEFEYIIAISN